MKVGGLILAYLKPRDVTLVQCGMLMEDCQDTLNIIHEFTLFQPRPLSLFLSFSSSSTISNKRQRSTKHEMLVVAFHSYRLEGNIDRKYSSRVHFISTLVCATRGLIQ